MAAPPPPTMTLPDRKLTWLVTGCSSGLGLALVRAAQRGGHKVIATSRNPDKNPDLVKEVESHGGKWVKLDVNAADCGKVVDQLEAAGDHIDVLVNNAGFCIYSPIECFNEEEARAMMETLYFGPFRLVRAVAPYMRQRRFGTIVNTSSAAGIEGVESMGAYAPPKAAIEGLSKVLAKELAPFNIRVLIAGVGTFNTSMGDNATGSKNPIPDDYKGSPAEKLTNILLSGQFKPKGDKDKAMQALYEVIVGEGRGKGHLQERYIPLGTDLALRVQGQIDQLTHSLETFGDMARSVAIDAN